MNSEHIWKADGAVIYTACNGLTVNTLVVKQFKGFTHSADCAILAEWLVDVLNREQGETK